jgi:hypothetical protein
MTFALIKKLFRPAALALSLSLASLAPVHAKTVVSTSYDPAYGFPFSGSFGSMFWKGTSNVVFEDGCTVPPASGFIDTKQSPGCVMYMTDAELGLYAGDPEQQGVKFATLSFGTQQANIGYASFTGGNLSWVFSDYFDTWAKALVVSGQQQLFDDFGVGGYTFTLAFSEAGALLFHATTSTERHDKHIERGKFWEGNGYGHLVKTCDPDKIGKTTTACGYSTNYADVTFGPLSVPEPGSVPLMLAGLIAVTFASRRLRSS